MTRRTVPMALLAALAALGACKKADNAADSAAAHDSTAAAASTTAAAPAAATDSAAGTAAAAPATQGGMLDPNTATRDQLVAVPGMTPAAADAIVAGRPYADMLAVNTVLAKQLPDSAARKQVYARVWKPIDLNTAKGDEILLIPGVGRKMRHEFEEYRPYKSIEQFRREIGKYVDKAEVARLEQYVMIK
jgi:DNA uptake protein ComE-like DNA-binding protein